MRSDLILNTKKAQWILGLGVLLLLAACDSGKKDITMEEEANSVGSPNPAAELCINEGGEYSLAMGRCTLSSGESVDAWEFYHKHQQE